MKTSSRILGTAFFLEGFYVQDAPRYGAERRGAPVFAYVRADHKIINERGVIHKPDLIIIADESLIHVASDAVFEGLTENTVLVIISVMKYDELIRIIPHTKKIVNINPQSIKNCRQYLSSISASAAARLTGKISLDNLIRSVKQEFESIKSRLLDDNIEIIKMIYDETGKHNITISESDGVLIKKFTDPGLINMPLHNSSISTPAVKSVSNSINNHTGSWRTVRPVINKDKCSRCMLCNVFCPDSVITAGEDGFPSIDYNHCKGCLICVSICPLHAIDECNENLFNREAV